MLDLFQFSESQLLAFALVLIRMSAFCTSWPVFGVRYVPNSSKVLLALTLTGLIFPVVNWTQVSQEVLNHSLVFLVVKEAFIGLLLGMLGRLFFYGVSAAGQLMSLAMGLSSASVFNPSIGSQGNVIEQVQMVLVTLFFLIINGHHHLLAGIIESFSLVPLSMEALSFSSFGKLALLGQDVLIVAVKISSPVVVSIILVNMSMGIIGRAVPQINVLVTSIPVNILVGFIFMIFSIPLLMGEFEGIWIDIMNKIFGVMKTL